MNLMKNWLQLKYLIENGFPMLERDFERPKYSPLME